MPANDRVRIGFIGLGTMGQIHIQYFSGLPSVVIAAVADPVADRREQVRMQFGAEYLYADGMDLIAGGDLDAVVITTNNKSHAKFAIAALNAGMHVLLEKPMATSSAEAEAILQAEAASGKALLIGHHLRFSWPIARVSEQVRNGEFGDIYYVKAGEFRRKYIPAWGTPYTQRAHSAGGAAVDIGVHMLDLAMHMLGDPVPVAVSGIAKGVFGPRKLGLGSWGARNMNGVFDVEDFAAAMIRLESGAVINLEVSWAALTDAENNRPFIHMLGSEGGFSLKGSDAKWMLEAFDEPVDRAVSDQSGIDPRLVVATHFVDCIAGRAKPAVTGWSGYVNTLILEGLYRSAEEGREIALPALAPRPQA